MSVGWLSRRFEALAPIGAAMRTDRRRGGARGRTVALEGARLLHSALSRSALEVAWPWGGLGEGARFF